MTQPPIDLAPLAADALLADPRLGAALATSDRPLALLPVRLETRYAAAANGTGELLVRIYPDQLQVDAHDPRLSTAEQGAGQEYWRLQWRTGDNTERQRRAFQAVADRFGAGRAAWVTTATLPSNGGSRPSVEVADEDELSVEPVFPVVELAELRRTPVARLLPQRWTATAYAGGQITAVVTGAPVTPDLAVGPDLNAPLVRAESDEVAAIDTGMNWLVDFAAAERAGMALRLPVAGPIDLLVVTGVGDDDGAEALRALLAAQRYTEGLAFLAPETTTNNAEQRPSGWSSDAAAWLPGGGGQPVPDGFAATTSAALGLGDSRVLAGLPNAGDLDPALTGAMATVLWPATWSYWLTQFGGADAATDDWGLGHARRFVRPGGPLPTLRVGRQPYGVLPVTSLNRFAGDERQNRLRRILVGVLDGAWRPLLGRVPRVSGANVAAELVDVLRLQGRSTALGLRRSVGARFGDNATRFLGHTLGGGFWDAARDRALPIALAAGVGLLPGALTVHEPVTRPVTLPLISPDGDLRFLSSLAATDADALAADADQPQPSVLAALVRHGLLRRHANAAARLLGGTGRDAELYGFGDPDLGWTAQRDQSLPDGGTVRQRVAADDGVRAFAAAVQTLAAASPRALERHLLGTLDAAAHRVDAWVTSLAGARLAELRATRPSGVVVGGYGWVEGLRPTTSTPIGTLPAGEPAPLLATVDDPGFIHAPSVQQAQVSALLRNAHLSHGGGETDPFAISLTSQRVRLARWVFDGVRAGRSVGAVLGYLVERDLHERNLDFAIRDAREFVYLPGQEELPVEARRLDGLKLHELWVGDEGHAVDHLVAMSRTPTDDERRRAIAVLRALNAAVDACADALQAEQVHQFARGDLTRAVIGVADVDRGLAPPPDLDFLATPRGGAGVTHRVAILLDPDAAAAPGWGDPRQPRPDPRHPEPDPRHPEPDPRHPEPDPRHPGLRPGISVRATAEPGLDAWLGVMLGPAGTRSVTIAVDGTISTVPLSALSVAASDLVRMAAAGEAGELEVAARAALAAGLPVEGAALVPDRPLLELLELARSLSALVTAAKPLDGVALQPPHADPADGADLAELRARVATARAALEGVVAALAAVVEGEESLDAMRDAVEAAWSLGVGEAAFPRSAGPDAWRTAAGRVLAALRARLAEADAVTDGERPMAAALARLAALLGPGFVALPRFLAPDTAGLAASRDDPALTGGDPLAAEVWFTRMERVRDPLRRAGVALREAEALGGPAFDLAVAQLPHQPGATWNALPASSYADGAVSLALVGAGLVRPGRTLAGLLVDEWAEVVPSGVQTTGVAFAYDPPEAMAPQAILLAVPPVVGEPWTLGRLNQVLIETLELAHLRAVPPSALGAIRQYLPAAVLAYNAEGDAVSTNPGTLTPPATTPSPGG